MPRTRCRDVLALARGPPRKGVGPESVSHDHDDADLSRYADVGARTARGIRRSLAAGAGCRDGSARARQPHGARRGLSVALLLTLDRLSPLGRAAFLLHDVFDFSFSEVAAALERSEPACRQLAARARAHVRAVRPRRDRRRPVGRDRCEACAAHVRIRGGNALGRSQCAARSCSRATCAS